MVVDAIESKLYIEGDLVMHRRRPQKTQALELNLPPIYSNTQVVLKVLPCIFVTSTVVWKLKCKQNNEKY